MTRVELESRTKRYPVRLENGSLHFGDSYSDSISLLGDADGKFSVVGHPPLGSGDVG